jgi:hypothetical protein
MRSPLLFHAGNSSVIDWLHDKSLAPAARALEFASTSTMWDHFGLIHLVHVERGSYLCRACSLGFLDAICFNNHVATVRGIFIRPWWLGASHRESSKLVIM